MAYTPEPRDRSVLVPVRGTHVRVIDTGSPEAMPVVFLHGGGPGCTGWSDWHPVGERLRTYRRVYVDFPYYGESSAAPIDGPMWQGLADIVGATLDALGICKAHMVCQSFGGAAAIALAGSRPELFTSLTLTGTVLEYGIVAPYMGERLLRQVVAPMYDGAPTREDMRTLLEVAEWVDAGAIPDALVDARLAAARTPAAVERFTCPEVLGEAEDLGPLLRRNRVPTLLAYGDRDPFAAADVPVHLFNVFSDARLVMVKDASHHFPEEIPDTYLSILVPWLLDCEARSETLKAS